jgi:hypothetical protein
MKFILGIITTLVLIVLIAATALGVVPILSPLVGAGPKDLGIRITPEQSKAARDKVGTEIISLPAGTEISKDYTLEGKQNEDFTFTSEELTAYSNNRPWKNFPVRNLQIKIHTDGSLEGSGILVVSKAMPYAVALGYSESQIRDAMDKYHIPTFEVPFYVAGSGSVTNDQVTVNANTVKVGAVTIPQSIVAQANTEAASVLTDIIHKHSNSLHAESLTFQNGTMHYKGQSPLKEYVITQ